MVSCGNPHYPERARSAVFSFKLTAIQYDVVPDPVDERLSYWLHVYVALMRL